MNSPTQGVNQSSGSAYNFEVKEQEFSGNQRAIPIAGKYSGKSGEVSAIGEYKIAPTSGTYVLGSVDGEIQWIATEDCDA